MIGVIGVMRIEDDVVRPQTKRGSPRSMYSSRWPPRGRAYSVTTRLVDAGAVGLGLGLNGILSEEPGPRMEAR